MSWVTLGRGCGKGEGWWGERRGGGGSGCLGLGRAEGDEERCVRGGVGGRLCMSERNKPGKGGTQGSESSSSSSRSVSCTYGRRKGMEGFSPVIDGSMSMSMAGTGDGGRGLAMSGSGGGC